MRKFISIWSILAMLSAAVAIDFYFSISSNANPTGEQLLVACFVIGLFSVCALVFIGAHIEHVSKKS